MAAADNFWEKHLIQKYPSFTGIYMKQKHPHHQTVLEDVNITFFINIAQIN